MEGKIILVIGFISRMDRKAALKAAIKLQYVRGYGVAEELVSPDESYPCMLLLSNDG